MDVRLSKAVMRQMRKSSSMEKKRASNSGKMVKMIKTANIVAAAIIIKCFYYAVDWHYNLLNVMCKVMVDMVEFSVVQMM